jgi:hypothetical protein
MNMEYPNSGKLSPNKWKKDKQPDMKGQISLERSLLKRLMNETDDDDIVIKLSGWNRTGQYGEFINISYDSYKKPDEPIERVEQPKQKKIVEDDSIPF